MNYTKTRNKIIENVTVRNNYLKMLEDAEKYLLDNFQELDEQEQIEERKIGMANYMKDKKPEKFKDMDVSEIVDWFIELNEKYDNEYKIEPKDNENGRTFYWKSKQENGQLLK